MILVLNYTKCIIQYMIWYSMAVNKNCVQVAVRKLFLLQQQWKDALSSSYPACDKQMRTLLMLLTTGYKRDAVCTRELLRCHTMPTESSESSVCVLFVSLCVIPIAIWAHSVPLCRLISPFLKPQAPLLSSSGFRRLPLPLTLDRQWEIWMSAWAFAALWISGITQETG